MGGSIVTEVELEEIIEKARIEAILQIPIEISKAIASQR